MLAAAAAVLGLTGCASDETTAPDVKASGGVETVTTQPLPEGECAPIRAIVDPIVADLPADDTPAPAATLAAAPEAVAALEALPETSTTAGLLRDFFVADLGAMIRSGEVPTSLVNDVERLDRYCPAG